jgi:hypothetical protein
MHDLVHGDAVIQIGPRGTDLDDVVQGRADQGEINRFRDRGDRELFRRIARRLEPDLMAVDAAHRAACLSEPLGGHLIGGCAIGADNKHR